MQKLIETLTENNSLTMKIGDVTVFGVSAPGWAFLLLNLVPALMAVIIR